MKNPILFLTFLCLLNSNHLSAQNQSIGNPPNWNWVRAIGGNSGADHGQSIVGDAQGNFFIAGDFSGTTQFDNTSLTTQGQTNGFVAKCDPLGGVLWTKQFKSSSPDGKVYASSVALDPDGNIVVLGHFRGGDMKLGNQTYYLTSSNSTDLFLAKFGPNGALIWLTTQSAFLSNGLTNGKVLADSDASIFVLGANYLWRFSSTGNLVWAVDNPSNTFSDMALKGNSLYFTGLFSNEIQLGNELLNTPNTAIFLTKVDKTNGNFYNASVLASNPNGYDIKLNSISMVNETDFFLAGNYSNNLSVGPFSFSNPGTQYFVAKFVSGSCAWAFESQSGSAPPSYSSKAQILADPSGDAYFFGNKTGALSFGNSPVDDAESGFLAKFDGFSGQQVFLKAQPPFISGWAGGTSLLQIGAPFYEVATRKSNSEGGIAFTNVFDSDSGLGYVTSAKTDNTGVYFSANVSAKTYFLGQSNYNSTGSIVVTQTNHAGNTLLWQKTIAGASSVYTYGHSLWLDKNHEKLYLIGSFPNEFYYGAQLVDTTGGKGVFVAQMGTDGSFGWIETLPKTAYINSVITDAAGNVIINGTFSGELHLGNITLVSAGSEDIFWAKLSANGQFLLAQRMGGESVDYENYAGIDAQGNFYMSGNYDSYNIDFNGTNQTTRVDGDGLIFHVKFAPDGQVLWIKNFGNTDLAGTEYNSAVTNVEVDAAGNSYIIGYHGKSTYFGNHHLTSPYNFNSFALKLDPAGDPIWVKSIRTKRISYNFCEIGLDEAGDCYIGGQYRDSIYFDGTLITKVGAQDAYFAKLDGANGDIIWVKTISGGPEAVAWPATISVYDEESLFVGGHIEERLNFDATSVNTYDGRKGYLALIGQNIMVSTAQPTADAFLISVSPNPTAEKVTVSNQGNPTDHLLLEIFSASGQLVAKQAVADFTGKTILDLSANPAGIYFLKASSQGGQQIVRLVKK